MTFNNLLSRGIIVGVFLMNVQLIIAANVKRITAETDDGLFVTVWTEKSVIRFNQDMAFHYTVKNNSKNTIYWVTEPNSSIYVEGNLINTAESVLPRNGESFVYNYEFLEIKSNESFQKEITVPFDKFKSPFEKLWNVKFGFIYVLNKEGLDRKRKPGEDPLVLNNGFASQAITIDLSSLEVSVRK